MPSAATSDRRREQYAREAFDRYGGGRRHGQPVPRHRLDRAVPAAPDGWRVRPLPNSNPGSGDFQSLEVDGEPLYAHVARRVRHGVERDRRMRSRRGRHLPRRAATVRAIVGDLPLLVPGVGAQGGDIEATVAAGADSDGYGMVINSSRAILYASSASDFADAAPRRRRTHPRRHPAARGRVVVSEVSRSERRRR